jgi:hypothetical protein
MRKITIIVLLLLFSLTANAQTESFAAGTTPTGWTATSITFVTTGVMYAQFTNLASTLITPSMPFMAGATLTFQVAKFGSGTDGPILAEISYDGGMTWPESVTSPIPTSATYVTSGPTPLTGSGNVMVRFTRAGSPSQKRLDNVTITTTSLPVKLTKLEVTNDTKSAVLTFTTASERNNSHFEIERSADGQTFRNIGEVKGAGNSNEEQSYRFTDQYPVNGINYYRIKQVDFDGKFEYSKVVTVRFGRAGSLSVIPTLVVDQLSVSLDETNEVEGTWEVIDLSGRQVLAGVMAAEQAGFQADLSSLQQGTYVIRIQMGSEVLTERVMKL